MDINQVLEKCKKLSRLSSSSNENEAAAAAAKLSELMISYEIDEAQIAVDYDQEKSPIVEKSAYENAGYTPRKKVPWQFDLAYGLALSTGSYTFYFGPDIKVFGRRDQVTKVQYMLQYLTNEVNRLAEEAWNKIKHEHWESARAFKSGFRRGAAGRIRHRLEGQRAAVIEQRKLEASDSGNNEESQALVLLEESDQEVESEYKQRAKSFKQWRSAGVSSISGYSQGVKAGTNVRLEGGAPLPSATPRIRKG